MNAPREWGGLGVKQASNPVETKNVNFPLPAQSRAATPADRRRHPRQALAKAAKVTDGQGIRFWSAETVDVSDSGLLLAIRGEDGSPGPLPGSWIRVGVAWGGQGFLRESDMTSAKVIRALRAPDGTINVAVELKTAQAVARRAA